MMTSRVSDLGDITPENLEPISKFKILMSILDNPSTQTIHKQVFEFFDDLKDFLNENIGSVSN